MEGYNDVAAVFRSTAAGETGHARGHLEFLEAVGDPATGLAIGKTSDTLKAAVAGETHEYTDMYPAMVRVARTEGFDAIAAFSRPGSEVVLGLDRPNYGHMAVLAEALRAELAGDFG